MTNENDRIAAYAAKKAEHDAKIAEELKNKIDAEAIAKNNLQEKKLLWLHHKKDLVESIDDINSKIVGLGRKFEIGNSDKVYPGIDKFYVFLRDTSKGEELTKGTISVSKTGVVHFAQFGPKPESQTFETISIEIIRDQLITLLENSPMKPKS
jgi:hypothetical protein